ncbi:TrkH family potassium uptake protein [Xanthovirga aplysinae]|uniref:TrkH family potassium uptake protein n=1 Tax=Xanthovirga aplysinae TaxID=2529853 RepID=UPI0012BBB8EF|nr:potassium transporter TrkG [Xanthovirga aplysinae]MTI32579.1 ATPase [Xanthovirga aplysinae]
MFRRKINEWVEKLNHFLYTSRSRAVTTIRSVYFLSSLGALAILVYIIGFDPDTASLKIGLKGLNIFFTFHILTFLGRWLYSFQRIQFLKQNKFRAVLAFLLLLHVITHSVYSDEWLTRWLSYTPSLGVYEFYQMMLGVYLFFFVAYSFVEVTTGISRIPMQPATIFLLSFLLLISIGTGLLMLPSMTVMEGSMPFLDALFTSTSASCVTGLIVVDTATYFTFKGHVILLLLIQFGGLGIISFASYFTASLTKGIGLKHQSMLQEFLSGEDLYSTIGLLKQIFKLTLFIEGIGAILIFFTWGAVPFTSIWQKIFYSLFHAVSGFCNAGFSLYTNNMYEPLVKESYLLHIVILAIVILGGIGFATIQDVFSPVRMRDRLVHPWKDWQLGTKIAIYMSAGLLVFGALSIFLLEENHTLREMKLGEAVITSFFQSGVARTAGFNTIDIGALRLPSLMILIFLMFIGASSGSVGGGIKTSTFYVILSSVVATLTGRQKIEIGRRFIPNELVFKAMTVFVFAVIFNLLGIFVLTLTEPNIELIKLAFEQVSAFATVGLSTGITANLSETSMAVITLTMFVGRVGTLTVALVLSRRVSATSYRYPKAHLMIG